MLPRPFTLSPEDRDVLRRKVSRLDEITPFSDDLKLGAWVASLGIHREVGTANDEISRFIFDANTGMPVPREVLKSTLVKWGSLVGVSIRAEGYSRLEIRAQHFRQYLHPDFSFNDDDTIKELVIFPEIIAKITQNEGVDLVIVKSWATNSIFGGFDPAKEFYETNFWELENNDALLFSRLLANDQLAFLGTHDLIAHIAGVNKTSWGRLKARAVLVNETIEKYFGGLRKPTIASLLVPYTIGVVLDDLAQPPSYDSKSHSAVLAELIRMIRENKIHANMSAVLTQFPSSFETVINLSRSQGIENNPSQVTSVVAAFVQEIISFTVGVSPQFTDRMQECLQH